MPKIVFPPETLVTFGTELTLVLKQPGKLSYTGPEEAFYPDIPKADYPGHTKLGPFKAANRESNVTLHFEDFKDRKQYDALIEIRASCPEEVEEIRNGVLEETITFPPGVPSGKGNPVCVPLDDPQQPKDPLFIEFKAPGTFDHSPCDNDFFSPIPTGHFAIGRIGPFHAIRKDHNIVFTFKPGGGVSYTHKFDIKDKCP
jgi:hypothetical protein